MVPFMKNIFRNNGLSIALISIFFICQALLTVVGHQYFNAQQLQHGEASISYLEYLGSAELMEATMENWESEFLQMFAFVFMTVFLYQRGAAESRDPDEPESEARSFKSSSKKAPWPVRRGGWMLRLYENSLSLSLLVLFVASFVLHAWSGARVFSAEELAHGGHSYSTVEYLFTARFWFESLQNWQSEFLSIGVMVLLSIWLRQRGSPESKPVNAPHSHTGTQ